MNVQIQVRNKAAVNLTPEIVIICGNSDYVIEFDFDDEWASEEVKTARFVYRKGGQNYFEDVVFSGTIAKVPVLSNINHVLVGVYAGDLITTTPAVVECDKSILCGSGTHKDPTPDIYNQLIELINSMERTTDIDTVTSVDFTNFENGSYVETLEDGTANTVSVTFDSSGRPNSIGGVSIVWGDS